MNQFYKKISSKPYISDKSANQLARLILMEEEEDHESRIRFFKKTKISLIVVILYGLFVFGWLVYVAWSINNG